MGKTIKKYLLVLTAVMMFGMCGIAAGAGNVSSYDIKVTYGQTEARSMLAMINAFRTGSDAWHWNSDNTTKTTYTDLQPLTYDYQLEKVAMQRAYEIAVYYSHARPGFVNNGSDATKAWPLIQANGGYRSASENIAAGYTTAESVFIGWREDNDAYIGQGHRRNMLSPKVTAVGIGHVYYAGYHYWVQLFRDPVGSTAETAADNTTVIESVDIISDNISNIAVETDVTSVTLTYLEDVEIPEATVGIYTTEGWPSVIRPVEAEITWDIEDTSVADLTEDRIAAVSVGTTTLTASALGVEKKIAITVEPASIKNADITLSEDIFYYDGNSKAPEIAVAHYGDTALDDSDFDISYKNNRDAGTAAVVLTGEGNFTGTYTIPFKILPAEITVCDLNLNYDVMYTGNPIEFSSSLMVYASDIIVSPDNYDVRYTNNTNAGTAKVTVNGKGNYTGSVSAEFEIHRRVLGKNSVTIQGADCYTYSGSEITPSVTVSSEMGRLTQNVDYSVTYKNNVEPGTATIVVEGIRNYEGTIERTFTIEEAPTGGTNEGSTGGVTGGTNEGSTGGVTGGTNEGSTGGVASVFQIGEELKNTSANGYFTVTGHAESGVCEVQYAKPVSKSKKKIVIPAAFTVDGITCKVTSIAKNAFKGNKKITSVTIGKNVTTIESGAFSGCTKLSKVTIGSNVTAIGTKAFYKCTALKAITIPSKVTKINKQAFYGCKKLKSITIKTTKLSKKKIGSQAFTGVYKKATIKVPKSKLKTYKSMLRAKGVNKSAVIKK